jgi:cardiolipin synthase A/B
MTGFTQGNRVDLLRTGDEYFPAVEAAIAAARAEVHLEAYIFSDDPTGHRMAHTLAEAARRGVSVRLMVDGFGADNLVASLRAILEPAGVQVLVFRPELGRLYLRRHRLRRLHRKLVVIDGEVGFCGGINVIDDRDGRDSGPPRFDFAVRVWGPLVTDMHRAVQRLWTIVELTTRGRAEAPRLAVSPWPPAELPGRRAAFLIRDNISHRRAIEEAYLGAIASAEREVFIACAYFLPGRQFRRALRDAALRGVRVRLLLQGLPEHLLVHHATHALYGSLIDAGIEIHEYTLAYLHAKVAVIDGRWATVGSSNIDPFSLLLSREANVVVEDEGFASELRTALEAAVVEGAVAIIRETWARKPWTARVASWVAFQISRILMGLTGYARADDW